MIDLLLDIIFPQNSCCLCQKPGFHWSHRPWCPECEKSLQIQRQELVVCQKCGKYLNSGGSLCIDCEDEDPPFFIARSVGPYSGDFRKVTMMYKFLRRKGLAVKMARMMSEVIIATPEFGPLDLIVPVPSSENSMSLRGFNQSALLATRISGNLKVPANEILVRVKETSSQKELSRQERETNLKDAFVVKDGLETKIRGKEILLVDDVYTTGSTTRECTRILLEAEAKKVSVITWASGKGY
ncbi:MAG: ComF family protein [Chitinophagales bacterium]